MSETINSLIPVTNITPAQLFTEGKMEPLLEQLIKEVRSFAPDISTKKGRDEIKSLAHKVATSKTYLDDLGFEFVSDMKKKSKQVDDVRKAMRDRLDALKEEVRKPLTDWENKDKERLERHEDNVSGIVAFRSLTAESDYISLSDDLKALKDLVIDSTWEEFEIRANRERDESVKHLEEVISKRLTYEKEQEELKRLRLAEEERKKKEHEERIAKEASEKAEREKFEAIEKQKKAEEEAKLAKDMAEKQRIESEEREKKLKAQAEADKKMAEERAREAERKRIEQEKKAEEEAKAKREADLNHRRLINNEVLTALVACAGLTDEFAKKVVEEIAKGRIPNVKITY